MVFDGGRGASVGKTSRLKKCLFDPACYCDPPYPHESRGDAKAYQVTCRFCLPTQLLGKLEKAEASKDRGLLLKVFRQVLLEHPAAASPGMAEAPGPVLSGRP